jgi:hypothetical protein
MAGSRAKLVVDILTDASKSVSEINKVTQQFAGMGDKIKSALTGVFTGVAVAAFAKETVQAASSVEQAMGGVAAIFGKSQAAITDWANNTADNFRVPADEAMQFAAATGNALQQAGFSASKAATEVQKLGDVGADLAAVFGGPGGAAGAVDALNAAISKGEFERLESFGVTIKAADVSAEVNRIASSMGGLTTETEAAIRTQATLNLIYREAAPALGGAAKEAETFASKQDELREKVFQLKAALGADLLPAVVRLMDAFIDLLPAIQAFMSLATGLVALIAGIPTPILVAAAGFLALAKSLGTVSLIAGLASKALAALGVTSATAGVGKLVGLLSKLGGATKMFGGLGLAVGAAGAVFAVLANQVSEAEAELERLKEQGTSTAKELAKVMRELEGDALAKATQDIIKLAAAEATWGDGQQDIIATGEQFGISATLMTQAMLGQGDAAEQVIAQLTAYRDSLVEVLRGQQLVAAAGGQEPGLVDQSELDAINEYLAAVGPFMNLTGQATDAIIKADIEAENYRLTLLGLANVPQGEHSGGRIQEEDDFRKAAKAADDLADAIERARKAADSTTANNLLWSIENAADDAARATEILAGWISTVQGRTADESSIIAWSRTLIDAGEAAEEFAKSGQAGIDALANWDVAALQFLPGGQDVTDQFIALAETFPDVVSGAFTAAGGMSNVGEAVAAARTAAGLAYDDFIKLATGLGLPIEQAEALAAKLGILDETQISDKPFQLIAEDERARVVLESLEGKVIDPATMEIIAGADGAKGTIDDVLTYVDETGKVITVPLEADPKPAEDTAAAFTDEKRDTTEVKILATSAPARLIFEAFKRDYENTILTVQVKANTGPAGTTVELFKSAYENLQITADILGDASAAEFEIATLTQGYYSATVYVKANVDQFWATFAALPGFRAITGGGAPVGGTGGGANRGLLPEEQALLTFPSQQQQTAGTSSPSSRGLLGTAVTYNITVNGALDPDAVARQIDGIMQSRVRRSSAITVRA